MLSLAHESLQANFKWNDCTLYNVQCTTSTVEHALLSFYCFSRRFSSVWTSTPLLFQGRQNILPQNHITHRTVVFVQIHQIKIRACSGFGWPKNCSSQKEIKITVCKLLFSDGTAAFSGGCCTNFWIALQNRRQIEKCRRIFSRTSQWNTPHSYERAYSLSD